MKKEFKTKDAKFVYSKKELGYQEVLDRFEEAYEITIVTYNISERQIDLINALKRVGDYCLINVITNIPSRWENYYGDTFSEKAKQKINLYMTKLNPEKLGLNSVVFFDFSNHGKIIMTDSIAYVGSANYSEESSNNTEFGFIIEDKEFLEFIRKELLPDLKSTAIPYYEYDYTSLLLEANVALSAVFNIKNELYETFYRLHDGMGEKWYYDVEYASTLTEFTLNKIMDITREACKVANDIYDAIDVISKSDDDEMIAINDLYEDLLDLSSRIEEIRGFDSLIELSEFDSNEYINKALEQDHSLEAYEENLQKCIDSALEEAQGIVWELTHKAKDDADELIKELQKYCDKYAVYIENLRKRKIKRVNTSIDNT